MHRTRAYLLHAEKYSWFDILAQGSTKNKSQLLWLLRGAGTGDVCSTVPVLCSAAAGRKGRLSSLQRLRTAGLSDAAGPAGAQHERTLPELQNHPCRVGVAKLCYLPNLAGKNLQSQNWPQLPPNRKANHVVEVWTSSRLLAAVRVLRCSLLLRAAVSDLQMPPALQ